MPGPEVVGEPMQERWSTPRLSKATQFLAAAAIILIAGCADMQTPVKTAILGIGDVAAQQEVDVVLIHGMGSSSGIGWAADANAKLAAALERSFDEQAFQSRSRRPPERRQDRALLGRADAGRFSTRSHRTPSSGRQSSLPGSRRFAMTPPRRSTAFAITACPRPCAREQLVEDGSARCAPV